MTIEDSLARIADALEALLGRQDDAQAPVVQPTLTNPPLTWFDAGNGCAIAVEDADSVPTVPMPTTAQTTWDWLMTFREPSSRTTPPPQKPVNQGRPDRRGRPLRCGRCRREGRSRMNHSNRCIECQHEEWWDE